MVLRRRSLAVLAFLLSAPAAVAAVTMQYSVVPMGGNTYRYIYSLTNTGSSGAVQLFSIIFDPALYQESSLQIVTPAPLSTQWSQQILHSVPPGVPAAYDALALTGGIAPGTTVTGFSVQFTYLGSGTPGAQSFQVFDPGTLAVVQTGTVSLSPVPLSIPAASTLALILLGMGLAAAAAYQSRFQIAQAIQSRSQEPR